MSPTRSIPAVRALAITASLIAAILALAACGGGNGSSNSSSGSSGSETEATTTAQGGSGGALPLEGKKLAFANFTDTNPLFVELKKGVEAAAEKVGAEVTTYDNEAESAKALNNVQVFAQSDAETLLDYNPDESGYKAIEELVSRAGKSCIAINIPGNGECPWFNLYNPEVAGDSGLAMGKYAEDRGWTGKDTSLILVNAPAAGPAINTAIGDFYYAIQDSLPGITRISSPKEIKLETTSIGDSAVQVDGQTLRGPSFESVSDVLQTIPKDRHVILYTIGDDSTLGGWQAIVRAGRDDDAMTAGFGGDPQALTELRTNPNWVAEGNIFFGNWGQYLMAMVKAMEEGRELPLQTISPEAVVTKDLAIKGTSVVPIETYYHEGEDQPFKLPPLVPVENAELAIGKGTLGNDYLAETGVLQLFGNVTGLGR